MAFELLNIQVTPSNERATLAAINSVQQIVIMARQCIETVDLCVTRAPNGADGILDVLCHRGTIKCQQFYDLYSRALNIVDDFKLSDDDPDEEDRITMERVQAAIARTK